MVALYSDVYRGAPASGAVASTNDVKANTFPEALYSTVRHEKTNTSLLQRGLVGLKLEVDS